MEWVNLFRPELSKERIGYTCVSLQQLQIDCAQDILQVRCLVYSSLWVELVLARKNTLECYSSHDLCHTGRTGRKEANDIDCMSQRKEREEQY